MPVMTRVVQDAVVLDLVGRFDSSAREEVQTAIDKALEGESRHIIFNLAGVPFIDSAAMGLLALNHERFQQSGGRISLVSPQPEVRLILDMAAMPKLIPSYRTIEDALSTPPDTQP